MKMITVRQPWAWLIVTGAKPVENRIWRTDYRGPLLIVASKRLAPTPFEEIARKYSVAIPAELPRGGIVGIAYLDDIVDEHPSPFFNGPTDEKGRRNWAFVLSHARELPPTPCAGSLHLSNPPRGIARKLGL